MARRSRLVLLVVGVATAVLLGRAEVAEPVRVSSDSMAPTLTTGDHVVLDKLTPGLGGLHRGDLVAFRGAADELILKRVVGLAGDAVELRDGQLYVNDRSILEPGIDLGRVDGTYFGPVTVGAGQVFVMGDNRANSLDSRSYGGVPVSLVAGRVLRWREPHWRY